MTTRNTTFDKLKGVKTRKGITPVITKVVTDDCGKPVSIVGYVKNVKCCWGFTTGIIKEGSKDLDLVFSLNKNEYGNERFFGKRRFTPAKRENGRW